jgi:hypothetical protein
LLLKRIEKEYQKQLRLYEEKRLPNFLKKMKAYSEELEKWKAWKIEKINEAY